MPIDDQDLLRFIAAHEVVVAMQVAALYGIDDAAAVASLESLVDRRLVSHIRVSPQSPTGYRVTPAGAARVDPALPELAVAIVGGYRHHLGVGWLWIAGHKGAFGRAEAILSARQMGAADAAGRSGVLLGAGATFGVVPLGRPSGESLAYPDVAVVYADKDWTGVHLLYALPDAGVLRATMQRYVPDAAPWGLFIVDGAANLRAVEEVIAELGATDKIRANEMVPVVPGG